MALIARFLIDTSAGARMGSSLVSGRLAPLITAGVVATCATLDAEALYSARGPAEYEQIRADRRIAYEYLPTEDEHWQQAFAAQRELAHTGRHRTGDVNPAWPRRDGGKWLHLRLWHLCWRDVLRASGLVVNLAAHRLAVHVVHSSSRHVI